MPTALADLVHQRAQRSVHLCGALKEALHQAGHPALARILELVEEDAAAALLATRLHAARSRRARARAIHGQLAHLVRAVGPAALPAARRIALTATTMAQSPGD